MNTSAPAHALVTGATGFLGRYLVEALLDRGWRVTALCRSSSDTAWLRTRDVILAQGDLLDRASIEAAIEPGTAVIFHTAADLSVWHRHNERQTRINVEGTRNVVAAALGSQRPRLVHISTIVARGEHSTPITEDMPSNAADSWINYERSKWLAEEEVRMGARAGLHACIVCPSATLGARDRLGWGKLFIDIAHRRVPFFLPGSGTFNDVRAVVAGIIDCAVRGRVGETYLLSGDTLTFKELMNAAAREVGVPAPRLTLPRPLVMAMAGLADWASSRRGVEPALTREMATLLCRHTICGSRKAEIELGYRPAPALPALRESIRWLREAGLIPAAAAMVHHQTGSIG